ncbi:L-lactate dehydrogenase [Aliifodinibius sp. S!AR15-10]|uniref:L-lactate dehydrogenase n=1 Tax=Aliifodinibius sp. S!AR15-10 TaxID=2950437 RepID=UPI0028658C9B|nr:L-lactate dehydrogenase [Aliifodinibius sp. S!AR15-10]MDR8391299.1 L-lactate dehydrogenase [Aliifodinibius sp. S!AR15-10]
MIQRRSVAIIGTGNVGVAAAYAMFNQRTVSEIILVDLNKERAEGEAMDLMHGQLLVGNVTVRAGGYEDLQDTQVVVVTAGVGQSSASESRLQLLNRNTEVFRNIIGELDKHAPDAILIIATNPVDILTYVSQKLSSRAPERIIGTGTLLDTARFRALIGRYYDVDPQSVHAYILGEHGDSEVPIWSQANIGGKPIRDKVVMGKHFNPDVMESIFDEAKNAAYKIIAKKGYTNSAIGVVIARIVKAILEDEKSVIPVSVHWDGEYGIEDVCMSLQCVVGIEGVKNRVLPDLDDAEIEGLRKSAKVLKESLQQIEI